MAFDIARAANGDVILTGGRDLAGVSGIDLINQRILTRLTVQRGTWFYDTDSTFGSNLHSVIGKDPNSSLQVESHVFEALAAMDEIEILQVDHRYSEDFKSVVIFVGYQIKGLADEVSGSMQGDFQQTSITLPLAAGR